MSAWQSAFEKAWKFREAAFETWAAEGTDSYRLFCGEREGIQGLRADRMGPVAFLYRLEKTCALERDELQAIAQWILAKGKVSSVYLKEFLADRSKGEESPVNKDPIPLAGSASDEEVEIRENGVRFLIRPFDGFSTGIFLDQRENRRVLSEDLSGATVLNLFAYTCGFSVCAARGGAATTSVDLSSRYLDWGKRNFAANAIPEAGHEFFAADAFQFLKGTRKRGRQFDLVILDPPSFSRDRDGGVFSVAKDAARLVESAASVLAPNGRLFFSTNLERWSQDVFLRQSGLAELGTLLPLPAIPKDFECQSQPLLSGLVRIS